MNHDFMSAFSIPTIVTKVLSTIAIISILFLSGDARAQSQVDELKSAERDGI